MIAQPRKIGRGVRLLGKVLFATLTLCCLTSIACPQADNSSQPAYDVTVKRLDLIKPGTVIDKEPPKGWSHLIIKSHPRIGAGDVKSVSKSTMQLSSLLYTAIVANVEAEKAGNQTRFRLTGAAVGLGTKVKDQDMIVSPEKQVELGANLKFLERLVLTKAQEKLQEVQVIARSDTMMLIDATGLLQRDGKHHAIILRYALLVDAATGKLETLLWVIDRDERGGYKGAVGPMEWLPPGKMEDCVLHVDANEFTFGVPSDNAFAMNKVPQGQKQIALADDLKPVAGRMRLTADMALQLETKLREAIKP